VEQAALDDWLQDDTHRQIYRNICNGQCIHDTLAKFEEFDVNEGYQRFQVSIGKNSRTTYRMWIAVAAAVMIFLTVSATIYLITRKESHPIKLASTHRTDVAPGGNRATLTLADGRVITLDEAQDGIVIGGGEITYSDGNRLAGVVGNEAARRAMTFLTLSTPKGGTYQVTLSDGTKVWLNAESTLKYPADFSGAERTVTLIGEAYFSVVKDTKRPFKVITDGQEIEVLGTEFNVSAYPEESEIKTTLVVGKVRLSLAAEVSGAASGNSQYLELVPGEQAIISGENLTK